MPIVSDKYAPHLGPYSPDEGIVIRRMPNGGVIVTSLPRIGGVEPVPVGAFGSWAEMVQALQNSAPAAPRRRSDGDARIILTTDLITGKPYSVHTGLTAEERPDGANQIAAIAALGQWIETPNEGDTMVDSLLGVIREVHGLLTKGGE